MTDDRDLLERAMHHFPAAPGIVERVYRRRDRRRRMNRVTTIVVTLVLVAVVFGITLRAFEGGGRQVPTGPITPRNVGELGLSWSVPLGDRVSSFLSYPNLGKEGGTYLSPAVGDGNVYVTTRSGTLQAFRESCENATSCGARWTGTLDGGIANGPTAVDGRVFVATEAGHLYAFSADCGDGGRSCSPDWVADVDAQAYSSPVVAGGMVYVHTVAERVFAFSESCGSGGTTCAPAWAANVAPRGIDRCAVNGDGHPMHECWVRPPVVADGIVYVVVSVGSVQGGEWHESIVALDAQTGVLRWSFEAPPYECCGVAFDAPSIAEGRVFVRLADRLYAFSAACSDPCSPLWTASEPGLWTTSPVEYDGTVFVATTGGGTGIGTHGTVYAFPADCASDGSSCRPNWMGVTQDEVTGFDPVVSDGHILVTSILGAFVDSFDAKCVPQGQTCAWAWTTGFAFAPQLPVGAEGVAYVAEGRGKLAAFDASCSGEACRPLWTWTDPQGAELSPPAVVGGSLFVTSSDGRLLAFSLGGSSRPDEGGGSVPIPLLVALVALGLLLMVRRRRSRRLNGSR